MLFRTRQTRRLPRRTGRAGTSRARCSSWRCRLQNSHIHLRLWNIEKNKDSPEVTQHHFRKTPPTLEQRGCCRGETTTGVQQQENLPIQPGAGGEGPRLQLLGAPQRPPGGKPEWKLLSSTWTVCSSGGAVWKSKPKGGGKTALAGANDEHQPPASRWCHDPKANI